MQKKNNDFYIRLFLIKNEIKILIIKSLIFHNNLNLAEKGLMFTFILTLYRQNKNFFRTKVLNKSIFSKLSGSVYRKFRLSRWEIKKYASFGQLKNLRKASW